MNLLGRLLLLFLRAAAIALAGRRPQKLQADQVSRQIYRVWPHDLDLNFHLTSARYLSFADLARFRWFIDNGILGRFLLGGYRAVISAQEITYMREFSLFSRVMIDVELMCWDQKYSYFEQRYYRCVNGQEQLCAVGHVRIAVLKGRSVMQPMQFLQELGSDAASPAETLVVTDWKETLEAKRQQFS